MLPSDIATTRFALLVIAVASTFVYGLAAARPKADVSTLRGKHWLAIALGLLVLWLAPSGLLAAYGQLNRYAPLPAPVFVLVGVTTIATVILAFSPVGTRLTTGVSLAGLVGFQAFRIPLEWVLHRLYWEGVIPVQMTYSGLNLDVVTGLSAAVLATLLVSGLKAPRVVRVWNSLGLGLLAIIVGIAVLSTPSPLRQFPLDPPNTLLGTFPFVWLATFFVQAALFGHLLVFRALRRTPAD